jgi:hypothetical protein
MVGIWAVGDVCAVALPMRLVAVVVAMGVVYRQVVAEDGPARQLAVEAAFVFALAVYATRCDRAREFKGGPAHSEQEGGRWQDRPRNESR